MGGLNKASRRKLSKTQRGCWETVRLSALLQAPLSIHTCSQGCSWTSSSSQ